MRSADRRDVTTVAPQALELLNGDFTNRQAGHFADRLIREAGEDPNRQIDLAFRLALGRSAESIERETLSDFLESETAKLVESKSLEEHDARRQALVQVCRIIFNLNEFVYTD